MNAEDTPSILTRHEFLIRRLHSLTGLIPVGAFMCVHLVTNASVLDGAGTFQKNVYLIHGLGSALVVIEWVFIFLPLLFHGIFGLLIVRGGLPNTRGYPYSSNIRYTLQRTSGIIAFVFIMAHVFHMHGWFHADWWVENIARPLGGAQFYPYSAASSAAVALQSSPLWMAFYVVGVLACVFHLANGIWTMGITWGVWTRPAAQQRASVVCAVFGVGLAAIGMGSLYGLATLDIAEAEHFQSQQYRMKTEMGVVLPDDKKLSPRQREAPGEQAESSGGTISLTR